jgi:hypothetical protein
MKRFYVHAMLLAAILLSIAPQPALAQEPTKVIYATWKNTAQPIIQLAMVEQVSTKQLSLINSGFSTFSVLEARTLGSESPEDVMFFKTACSIKFDTWQEVYDITKIEKDLVVTKIKTLDKYYETCLTAEIADEAFIKKYVSQGGDIMVSLFIDQLPAGRASEIKDWLIHQQSGVMQGLFGHMLGDLKLTERTTVVAKVPPLKQVSSKSP